MCRFSAALHSTFLFIIKENMLFTLRDFFVYEKRSQAFLFLKYNNMICSVFYPNRVLLWRQ